LREEHKFLFESRVLKAMFVLLEDNLPDLYIAPDIVRLVKSRTVYVTWKPIEKLSLGALYSHFI